MSGIGGVLSDVLATSPVVLGTLAGTTAAAVISGAGWLAARRRAAAAQAAQIAAEAARSAAEAARAEMESVPERTEAARAALEAAKAAEEAALAELESAQERTKVAKAAAKTAQAELESIQERTESAKAAAEAAKAEMEAAKTAAEAARAEMQAAKVETEAARAATEAARAEMESAQEKKESARSAAEAARAEMEAAQEKAVSARAAAEAAQVEMEAVQEKTEVARAAAEAARTEMASAQEKAVAARAEMEAHHRLVVDLNVKAGARRGTIQELLRQEADLRASYTEKKAIYDRLSHEVAALENRLDFAELGIYEPTFSFGTSAEYAVALETNRAYQKQMISNEKALVCPIDWSVDGSVTKGKTMTKRNIRLALRAFNNECEAILQKVSWKNYERMRERIEKSRQAIDKLNESNKITITDAYVRLKLEEIQLVHEESLRRKQEQDALREERAQEREELRAQRELEAEIRRAEVKEAQRREALEAAKAELEAATGVAHDRLVARLGELEHQLAEATAAKERALSLAQQTRVGHVYVISNIGSFGEGVFKVGMTRRLDPTDRVRELGDASVPFSFDVHAMIFTEDAPALERNLHAALETYRVNRVNGRKEFFKVPSETLKEIVLKQFSDVVYVDQAEAEEYYRSLPGEEIIELAQEQQVEEFPASL